MHTGTLQPYIQRPRREKAAPGTINHGLKLVRRIVNLAAAVIEGQRGIHSEFVFVYRGHSIDRMLNSAWKVCTGDRQRPKLVVLRRLNVS